MVFDGKTYRIARAEVTGEGEAAPAGEGPADRAAAPFFDLVDQDGEPLSLTQLRGKVLLIDFVYTACPGPCPILTTTLATLQRSLSPEQREQVRFVSISLDPERDTPEALRAYAKAQGADLSDWSFLTGPPEVVDEVVQRYGVGKVRGEDGQIEHVVVTFLVDARGRIEKRYMGLDHGADEMRADLEKLLS